MSQTSSALTMAAVMAAADVEVRRQELASLQGYLTYIAAREIPPWAAHKGVRESEMVAQAVASALRMIDRNPPDKFEPGRFKGYVRMILLRKIWQAVEHVGNRPDAGFPSNFEPESSEPTPSTCADRNEALADYAKAVAALPERDQQLLAWRVDDELSYAEIARRLDVSPPTARTWFLRAAREVLAAIGEELPDDADF